MGAGAKSLNSGGGIPRGGPKGVIPWGGGEIPATPGLKH